MPEHNYVGLRLSDKSSLVEKRAWWFALCHRVLESLCEEDNHILSAIVKLKSS